MAVAAVLSRALPRPKAPVRFLDFGYQPLYIPVRFEPGSPGCNGRLAQLGEHIPYKDGVTGSSPVPPTRVRRHLRGVVVQLVRTLACHVRGRGFESRRPRHLPRLWGCKRNMSATSRIGL